MTTPAQRREARQTLDRLVADDRISLRRPPLPRHAKEVAVALMAADAYLAEGSRDSFLAAAQFGNLYTACIDAANGLVEAYGYVSRGEGGHESVLLAAGVLLAVTDPAAAQLVAEVRNWMRPLRHAGTYEDLAAVTAADVAHARELAAALVGAVRREVCAVMGLDPDDTVWHPPDPRAAGS